MRHQGFVYCLGLMSVSFVLANGPDFSWNMTLGVTSLSREIYDLHMKVFFLCVGIGVVVFSLMLWAIIFHRKSLGHKAVPFHESLTLEIIWTLVPVLLLVLMAWPATRVLMKFEDTRNPDLTIKIVGYQWFWGYEYPEYDISFFSTLSTSQEQIENKAPKSENYLVEVDHPLVVPVGKKIRLLTTAADVQHSFWVPDLGFKKDAIPGFINEAWAIIDEPGIYRGRCAELCGYRHAYMPIVIHAVSEEDFDKYLLEMKKQEH
jgi:cytochrome c oxidase subunit 2